MQIAERIKKLSPWYQGFRIGGLMVPSRGVSGEGLWRKIKPMLPSLKGKKILDLGCNAGYMSYQMAKMGASVLGVDNSEHAIEQAEFCREFFPCPTPPKFIIEDLDLFDSDEEFHLVLASSILYHLKRPAELLSRLSFNYLLVRTRSDKLNGQQADELAATLGMYVSKRHIESSRRELILYTI
ncbi:MAG: class I SAM-dependent methyltransferase [Candidatus Thorarchaeota archaeon]|jgi:tRNA (mo5U34)-methyltransferase